MWGLIIAAAWIVAEYVYHQARTPDAPAWSPDVAIPLTTVDSPVPLLYGRVRVTAPILTYASPVYARQVNSDNDFFGYDYYLDMMFVVGIPFEGGANQIFGVYIGDKVVPEQASFNSIHPELSGLFLKDLTGNGNFEDGDGTGARITLNLPPTGSPADQGCVEFLNGNVAQQLVDPTSGTPSTQAGRYMTAGTGVLLTPSDDELWNYGLGNVTANHVPGYRGYLSAFLWSTIGAAHWTVGINPQVNAYSFEVGSYPPSVDRVGIDCNPVDVIRDLLTGSFGKLGIETSLVDNASFAAARATLKAEGHGFSRCFDMDATVEDMLAEICKQIDAVMYEEPRTGAIHIKLIRPDYDTENLQIINPDNCSELQNFAAGGWSDIANRVVLTFNDRVSDYKPNQAIAFSQANAVGQDGQVNELAITMPGITTQALANVVAARLLAAASRPSMKCRALVNRSFMRARLGDVYKLNWPEAGISNIVFRVAAVTLGALENGAVTLDLVQDYFYTHRNRPPEAIIDEIGGVHTIGDEIP